jgi:magnesium chelatase family protein
LDGTLRHIKGALPITVEAKNKGFKRIILPLDSVREASIVDGIDVYGLETFNDVINFLNNVSDNGNEFKPLKTSKE